ncbi:MAG: putative toxin-antitoxin system toxin component, PIN family [Bryobacterales bacterium]|nr:putative toxin-antitoxin system toxin component, PIN family [Bryobacterales bacterium]
MIPKGMIKVVIDTNVLVSGIMTKRGAKADVLDLVSAGRRLWCVSEPIVEEYLGVLARPRFRSLDAGRVQHVIACIELAELVVPTMTLAVSRDGPDNRFLECAEVAGAEYLVTGNARDFPAEWKGTRVLGARKLLAVLQEK